MKTFAWASSPLRMAWAIMLLGAIAACNPTDPPPPAPAFNYQPFPNLTREEREVEDRFAGQIRENLTVYVAAYRFHWGKVVNTDLARELSQDYAPDGPEAMTPRNLSQRTRYTLATQGPSRELATEIYRRMLREQPREGGEARVVFTAGGAGSGKSTSIRALPEAQAAVDDAHIVFDTTMSGPQAADLIEQAFSVGRSVTILYVYREPTDAFAGMIGRARDTGRPVSLSNFISTHLGAPRTISALEQRFGPQLRDGRLIIRVVDNTGAPEQAHFVEDGAQFLRARTGRYTPSRLEHNLRRQLQQARRAGLGDNMYNQIDR